MKKLTRKKLMLFTGLGLLLVFVIIAILTLRNKKPGVVIPPIGSSVVPPVVTTAPALTLISVDPPSGKRESIDGFTPTAFKFSAPVDQSSVKASTSPTNLLRITVFPEKPDTVFVEPQKTAWQTGVEYVITIKAGLRGTSGEELKEDIVYSFSNTPPEFIELTNPI